MQHITKGINKKKGCKKTVEELRNIPFPECYKECSFVETMGVGECESACPEKEEDEQ